MTLNTSMYVLDKVDVRELFIRAQALLGVSSGWPTDESFYHDGMNKLIKWRDEVPRWQVGSLAGKPLYGEDVWVIGNDLGQNLDAILDIRYRKDGHPLCTQEQSEAHDEDCEEDCEGKYHRPACFCQLNFDTGYGYTDERGWGCGDLHAHYLIELGRWLDERGIAWGWENEFTGEKWFGEDRYKHLPDLGSGGAEASEWFRNTVKPAIMADMDWARHTGLRMRERRDD